MVCVENLARVHGIEALLGALGPRHGDQPVEVGADHRRLAALLADALQPAQLTLGLLAHVLGHPGFLDLGAVLVKHRCVVVAELLADRLHLLAQEVLALLLLGARLDVVADAPAHLQLCKALALEAEGELEAFGHAECLEQLDLVLVCEVGCVAARVGEGARLGDGAHERGDAPVVTAQLEDLLDHGAVLALELAGAPVDRDVVGVRLDLDAQGAGGVGARGTDTAAVAGLERDRAAAAGKAHAVDDIGHGADARELVALARHEDHALLIAGLDRQRHRHIGEDDRVVDWNQQECFSGHLRHLLTLGKEGV